MQISAIFAALTVMGLIAYPKSPKWLVIGLIANVFTAAENEQLSAVSFYTASPDSSYQVYVYKNVASGPTTGSQAASKSGTIVSTFLAQAIK